MKAKVLIIGPTPPPYHGVSVATQHVLKSIHLSQNGLRVVHLDTADRRDISNIGRIDFRNIYMAVKHGLKYLLLLIREKPRIVYVPVSQDTLPFLRDCLFLFPARWMNCKVVIHLHGSHFGKFYQDSAALMRWIVRAALKNSASAIVLGATLQHHFDGILPAARVRVVPNGIPDFCSSSTKGKPPTANCVLFLSSLLREKGVHVLLEAIPKVLSAKPDTKFIFAGSWYRKVDRTKASDIIRSHGLENNVEFIGAVGPAEKLALLSKTDVFVLPTFYPYEGHPISILEAMCAGLPIISTRAGCIPETVQDGLNGFLIDPPEAESLAEKLRILLLDDALRARMGRASRERFLSSYALPLFQQRLLTVFKDALEVPSP